MATNSNRDANTDSNRDRDQQQGSNLNSGAERGNVGSTNLADSDSREGADPMDMSEETRPTRKPGSSSGSGSDQHNNGRGGGK
jgi:hypothetical protein